MTSPDSRLHRLTCPRQRPQKKRLGAWLAPDIRPVMRGPRRRRRAAALGFPLPFGHRHWLVGHPVPAPELGLPYGRLTPPMTNRRGPDEISTFRTCEIDRGGCPLYSGTAVLTQPTAALRLPPAASQRPVLHPSVASHLRGFRCRSIRGFTHVHPSGLPLACGPRMERGPLGSSLKLPTPPLPATPVEVGTSPEH